MEQMRRYAKESGLPVIKEWTNSADGKVRPAHQNQPTGVGGERRPLDEPFSNGLDGPSEPNCRCSVFLEVDV